MPLNLVGPGANIAARPAENQEHLQQWMDKHNNLPLPEMLKSLQNEPGFRELAPQVQQHEINELSRLYNMNPQQRSRMLDCNEELGRASPRPSVSSGAAQCKQLNALPPARRLVMARVILDLREMPPDQRQLTLNSPAFRARFSDSERTMLSTLLTVEPYTPPPRTKKKGKRIQKPQTISLGAGAGLLLFHRSGHHGAGCPFSAAMSRSYRPAIELIRMAASSSSIFRPSRG